MEPPASIVRILEVVSRQRGARWARLPGGSEGTRLWRARLPDGGSYVIKEGPSDRLKAEIRLYEALRGEFLPRLVAADTELGFLALEDLGDWDEAPPWTRDRVERAQELLEYVAATPAPPFLPPAGRHAVNDGWARIAADPGRLLGLFLVNEDWLTGSLPALMSAESAALTDGDGLVHLNVRGANVRFGPDACKLLDWTWAGRGNPLLDRAMLAVAVARDGGPLPEAMLGHQPAIAAAMSGFFASQAMLPGDPEVRGFQFEQLTVCLPWVCRALQLPDPLGGGGCFGGLGRL